MKDNDRAPPSTCNESNGGILDFLQTCQTMCGSVAAGWGGEMDIGKLIKHCSPTV